MMSVQRRTMKRHQNNLESTTPTLKREASSAMKEFKVTRTVSQRSSKSPMKTSSKKIKIPTNKTQKHRIYKIRANESKCRGNLACVCTAKAGCKMASGTKRTYCRKKHNTRIDIDTVSQVCK